MSKALYLKRLLDWGHTVEFEVSKTDLLFKVKMKSGDSTIGGENKDFWQALGLFLKNANFFVASLKAEEELQPLADLVVLGKKVELAQKSSSLNIKVNGIPDAGPLAEALKAVLA